MREKKILIDNLEANYKVAGEGKPLLILHGWPASSDSWIDVQERLSLEGYKVICPDFPGFGKSQTPPEAWSVGDYADWTLDFLKSIKIDKFILIGHSFGGRVAIKLSANHPKKIKKLVLCASAGLKLKPGPKARLIISLAKIWNVIFNNRFLKKFKFSIAYILYFFLKPFMKESDYFNAEGVMKETMKKVVAEDLFPYLSKIKTETLLVWGEDDRMVPLKCAKIFKKNIKNSKLKIISGNGHSLNLRSPEKLSEIIIKFLK